MHFGHLFINDVKMSKSIGNILRADKFLEKIGPNIFRLIFVLTNPLSPMKINNKLIEDAKKINNKLEKISLLKGEKDDSYFEFANLILNLNFAKAMALLHEELKLYNKKESDNITKIKNMIYILGLNYTRKQ
jgi:cysteinyl-tRNA synthetase